MKEIITIGYHKGEMDFGVNCSITELSYEQMNELRIMVCVAIGQAESMWRDAKSKHPSKMTENVTPPKATN